MKKNIILIIITAVVVAALAGVTIYVMNLPGDDEVTRTDETLDILLYDKTSVKPEEITVKNSGGEYSLVGYDYSLMADEASQLSEAEAAAAAAAGSDVQQTSSNTRKSETSTVVMNMRYTMQDYDDIELSKDAADQLAYQCSYVTALQLVDKTGSRYGDFGLDKPASTVTVQFSDGTQETLYVGSKAPNDMGYYFRREQSQNVYLVNYETISAFLTEKLQMFDRTITKEFNSDEDAAVEISYISISGEGYEKPIEIDKEEDIAIASTYKLRSPYHLAGAKNAAETFGKKMYGIKGSEVAAADVTEEDKKKFGLDKPYMDIMVKSTDDTSVSLIVSEKGKDGSCYIMADDGKVICRLTEADTENWYGANLYTFLTESFMYPNIEGMTKAEFTAEGKTTEFNVKTEKKKNDLYQDYIDTSVAVGGKEVDYNNFSRYIENLKGLGRAGYEVTGEEKAEQVYSARLTYGSGSESITDVLLIKKLSDGSYIVYLNDMLMGYTVREYAAELIAQTNKITGGESLKPISDSQADEEEEEEEESSQTQSSTQQSSIG